MREKGLSRDTIKYIAMSTMLLNHIATVFMEPGTIPAELFLNLGYFTAPVMCYFLVEGYGYTSHKEIRRKAASFCTDFSNSFLSGFYSERESLTLWG